jgi:hypothetical protein
LAVSDVATTRTSAGAQESEASFMFSSAHALLTKTLNIFNIADGRLQGSKRVFKEMSAELEAGWWITRSPSLWMRVRLAKDELLFSTRINSRATHRGVGLGKLLMKGLLRLLTFRVRLVPTQKESVDNRYCWQALLVNDSDYLLFDWRNKVVCRESPQGQFDSEYFELRSRLARHVTVPELVAAHPPTRQVEALVGGSPVLASSGAIQVDAVRCFLEQFDSLALAERVAASPVVTWSEACERLAAVDVTRRILRFDVIESVLARLQAASMAWATVPSHGDANLYHAVRVNTSYALIDTAKCAPRYEWHDSIHLLMFSGSRHVREMLPSKSDAFAAFNHSVGSKAVRERFVSRVARTVPTLDVVGAESSTSFEDLVLAFVIVGSAESAKKQPHDKDVFERSLRWHLGRPGVTDVLAGVNRPG